MVSQATSVETMILTDDKCHVAEIVMTPSKHGTTTSIRIEKVRKADVDKSQVAHTAGGQHQGLVINKQSIAGKLATAFPTKDG